MKTVEVSAAIIIKDDKILITQRGYGESKGKWEFPGGKVEPNEDGKEAIVREIKEELDADIIIDKYLGDIEYDYDTFHLLMHNYICHLSNNHIVLKEHLASRFVLINELDNIDFLLADIKVVELIKNVYQ